METPCLKFMNPKKKSPSFNWDQTLTNWVVFYLIKKSGCKSERAEPGEKAL